MVKESHLVGYGVQTQRTIWDSKVKFRNCLSVQIQHTNCSFQVSMLTVFKGASSIKIILVLKELTRPTCCRQFRVPFKRLFGWNSQTGFLFEDISNSFLFSWKFNSRNSHQLKMGCLTSSQLIWTKRANFKIDRSKYIIYATKKKTTDKQTRKSVSL